MTNGDFVVDQLLNSKKAAAFLRVSERTLERLRAVGEGPKYVKFGMVVRYDPADILAWIEGHKRASTSDCAGGRQGPQRRKAQCAPTELYQTSVP
jgi:predicted DNA-binding transcriptional regulator AlpA